MNMRWNTPLLATALLFLFACQDRATTSGGMGPMSRVVHAEGGLRLRGTPDVSGKVLLLIPDASEVSLMEEGAPAEVSGKKGRWTRVKFGDRTGWVFGAFLAAPEH